MGQSYENCHIPVLVERKILDKAEFKIQLKRRVAEVQNKLYFIPQIQNGTQQTCCDDRETRFLCLLHNDLIIDRHDSIYCILYAIA